MARPKTALNKAAEQHDCPSCEQPAGVGCINLTTGEWVSTHRARQKLVCQATFLNMPATVISGGKEWTMFCGRKAGHRKSIQHQTPDKRLSWDQGFGESVEDESAPALSATA